MRTILLQSAAHRQVHYRAPISRKTWCAQASRGRAITLFAIATSVGSGSFARGWMAVAGRGLRAHCSQRSSPPRKCSGGLRFRQTLHLDQPATAVFQSKRAARRKRIAFNASEHFFKFFPVQSLRLSALFRYVIRPRCARRYRKVLFRPPRHLRAEALSAVQDSVGFARASLFHNPRKLTFTSGGIPSQKAVKKDRGLHQTGT